MRPVFVRIVSTLEKISTIKKCSSCQCFADLLAECSVTTTGSEPKKKIRSLINKTVVTHDHLGCAICHSEALSEVVSALMKEKSGKGISLRRKSVSR